MNGPTDRAFVAHLVRSGRETELIRFNTLYRKDEPDGGWKQFFDGEIEIIGQNQG